MGERGQGMSVLELPGAAIRYEDMAGAGDAIVLVHGGMCDLGDWDRIVPFLAPRHRIVRLDLRGHGGSSGEATDCTIERWAADLLDLMAALGCGPAVLVGHSMASRVVAQAAMNVCDRGADGRVAGVVLLDGSRSHGGHARSGGESASLPADLDAVIEATIGPYADPATRAAIHATMASARPAIMAACVDAMRTWDIESADEVFAQLAGALPVLAIQSTYHDAATPRRSLGEADRSTPYLDFLRETLPQLEVALLPSTGHFSMLERPEAVAELVLAFASRAQASPTMTTPRESMQ